MTIKINVIDPVEGKELEYEVTWSNDLEIAKIHLDDIEPAAPRHAIVFFVDGRGDGSVLTTEKHGTGIIHSASGISASFTALAVYANGVEKRDRKYVRNRRASEQ